MACTAFIESDTTHPNAISAEMIWKATASEYDSGKDEEDFEVVEGVCLAKGTVRKACWNFGWCWISPPLVPISPFLFNPLALVSFERATTCMRGVGVPSLIRTLN